MNKSHFSKCRLSSVEHIGYDLRHAFKWVFFSLWNFRSKSDPQPSCLLLSLVSGTGSLSASNQLFPMSILNNNCQRMLITQIYLPEWSFPENIHHPSAEIWKGNEISIDLFVFTKTDLFAGQIAEYVITWRLLITRDGHIFNHLANSRKYFEIKRRFLTRFTWTIWLWAPFIQLFRLLFVLSS